MNICELSSQYDVRKLTEDDVEEIYELSLGNPQFFEFCPPRVTRDGIRADMNALPPNTPAESKFYIGYFDSEKLVAVMDLILGYPKVDTAWIGLFMVRQSRQGRGIGSGIIGECTAFLGKQGYRRAALAYAKGNLQSERFWLKNGFRPAGGETDKGGYTAVPMEAALPAGQAQRAPRRRRLWRADR